MDDKSGKAHEGPERFGLDDRSVEELKEKAIAAKGRAYCTCCPSTSLFFVLHSVGVDVNLFLSLRYHNALVSDECHLLPLREPCLFNLS